MFERNALIELRQWAAWPGYKPMVLRGARQVGKTTLEDQFAAEYDVYLKLNLEKIRIDDCSNPECLWTS